MENQLSRKHRRRLKRQHRKEENQAERKNESRSRNMKYIGYIAAILIVFIGAGFGISSLSFGELTGNVILLDTDYIKGDPDAPVTIIEFGDYQCPFCKRFFDTTEPLIEKQYIETGKVKMIFRHFPVAQIHPLAVDASEAALCAGEQDKFWDYHEILYSSVPNLRISDLKQYAVNLGLNTDQFNSCLDSNKYADRVQRYLLDAQASGVRGTPAFLINGQFISGAQPFNVFQQIIEEELAKTENY